MKSNYPKNNKNFLQVNKIKQGSTIWKNILDDKYLIEKGLLWTMGTGHDKNFW